MGVNTQGLIRGKVTKEELLNVIREKFDPMARIEYESSIIVTFHHLPCKIDSCQIYFEAYGENRIMHWFYDEAQHDMRNANGIDHTCEYTQISLSLWGSSKEIITSMVQSYSGYIDVNDCDDEGFIPL